jgi:nucleoside-diphosphate-sugar epimerase
MPNILILGATGYIGTALTQSLVRSGNHIIYGHARTPEKARSLAAVEVIPILAPSLTSPSLITAINTHRIDVVVDLAGADKESFDLLNLVKEVGKHRLQTAEKEERMGVKLGFIYCSGTWVHGSSHLPVNDLMPVGTTSAPSPPTELVAWRTELEKEVLKARNLLDVMIIRPALVYGRSCAIWTSLFAPLWHAAQSQREEKLSSSTTAVKVHADDGSRPGLVHVDDVASGIHCAVDRLPMISGTGVYPVFDLQSRQEDLKGILEAAARGLGWKGNVDVVGAGENLFARAMCTSGNCSSGRAKGILGWTPRREGFVEGMEVFVRAWEAARS